MAFNGVVKADRVVDPSYGLFSVAKVQKRDTGDEHWIGGFFVESLSCGLNTRILPQCSSDSDWISVFDSSGSDTFFYVPSFGILETYECDNSIGYNAIDRRATTVDQLNSVSEYAVERELWLGENFQASVDTGDPRWLASAIDATPVPGTAVSPLVALAVVEQNFAENNPGVQAVIHVTPLIASVLKNALKADKGKMFVRSTGSPVVISRGGVGDEGPATGGSDLKHWIYATGPVHVDLGSEELITTTASEIVNPKTNKVTYAAERPAAVYFDGCSWFGVLADATL